MGAAEIEVVFEKMLEPFPLADGVHGEDGYAVGGQPHVETDAVLTGFAVAVVAAEVEHRRKGPG